MNKIAFRHALNTFLLSCLIAPGLVLIVNSVQISDEEIGYIVIFYLPAVLCGSIVFSPALLPAYLYLKILLSSSLSGFQILYAWIIALTSLALLAIIIVVWILGETALADIDFLLEIILPILVAVLGSVLLRVQKFYDMIRFWRECNEDTAV
ncbi:MAG TPA: hypothetical protein PKC69_08220 [Chitinophagaceae bacterium]|nr:hypothetical protein [Chitinophagaceae bacterium]